MNKSKKITERLKAYHYKNTTNGIFVYIDTASGKEEVPLKSECFYSIIADDYQRQNNGETVSLKTIKESIFNFQGGIMRTQEKIDTKLRLNALSKGKVLLVDKGDTEYSYFRISQKGWQTKTDGDKYFSRNFRQAELPTPCDTGKGNIDLIFKYCRVPESMKNVFRAYIVSCFIPTILHPCLVVQGEAGSSKTTFCTFIKMLVDPCKNNAPCIFPSNTKELKDVYNSMYLAAYDNLERLNYKQSNTLCSIITGSQQIERKLYTNSESCVYDLQQPVILNGISDIISKGDLLDRSIIVELEPLSPDERKSEKALMLEFQKDLPYILGGIFDILVEVLKEYHSDSVPNPPRMIDFYEYGYYICEAIKQGQGAEFCAEYLQQIQEQKGEFVENRTLLELLLALLDSSEDNEWKGKMGYLSAALDEMIEEYSIEGNVPSSPNRLAREINLMLNTLTDNNVTVRFSRSANNCSIIHLTLRKD